MSEIDMSIWTGRDDTATEGPNALRWWQCVQPYTSDAAPGIVLIGFACDEGVRRNGGRVGAKDGPRALRKALANMAWAERQKVFDYGDVTCEGQDLESAQGKLAHAVETVVRAGHRPLVLGGGHETAWGTFQGVMQARPDVVLGILNLDSHFDLRRDIRATSGTPFKQIHDWCQSNQKEFHYFCLGVSKFANTQSLFVHAKEYGADHILDWDLADTRPNQQALEESGGPVDLLKGPTLLQHLRHFIQKVDLVYLSTDLDVLPASTMPAVSAPAARGVPLEKIELIMRSVAWGKNLIAADLVELNPAFDQDNQGARTAAYLAWQLSYWWHGPWNGPKEAA